MFAAIICFDLMGVMVRILSADFSAPELSAYRNICGVIPSLILMSYRGELRWRGTNFIIKPWRFALIRGVTVAIAQICFYSALVHLELATVSALAQTNAFFVVLVSIVMLAEKVGIWRWSALALGFAGAIWILRPGTDAFSPYALLPIVAAAGYAFSMVSVRKFDKSISSELLYLYAAFAAAMGSIGLTLFTTGFSQVETLRDAGLIFLMANTGGFAVILMMLAYRSVAPSILAPFGYFGILTAFFLGWLFFDEAPIDTLFPGVILIVAAGCIIIWRENRNRRQLNASGQ